MLDIFLILFISYWFFLFVGIGPYFTLTPAFLRKKYLIGFLMPLYGIALISILNIYFIWSNTPIKGVIISTLIAGITWQIFAFVLKAFIKLSKQDKLLQVSFLLREESERPFLQSLKQNYLKIILLPFLAIIPIVFLIFPILNAGFPTTPFRIGIDQVGYAETAQHLLDKGTLKETKKDILYQTNLMSLNTAKLQNDRSLSFNDFVDTEFLLKAKRWGYPATVAALTGFLKCNQVFRTIFLLLSISTFITIGLVYFIGLEIFELPPLLAIVIAFAFSLNVNYLNVLYEGEYAQIYAFPLLLLLMILYWYIRRQSFSTMFQDLKENIELRKLIFAFGFIFAGLMGNYNEANFFLFVFFCISLFLDWIFLRRIKQKFILYVALGALIGFLLVLPYSMSWFGYTIANLKNIKIAGFYQPHWASFAEIIGVFNLYSKTGYLLFQRSFASGLINLLLSLVLLGSVAYYIFRNKSTDLAFWLTPFVIILIVFLKVHYIENINNYQYMKAYTLLLPLLFPLTFAALYYLFQPKKNLYYFMYLFLMAVVFNGIIFIHQFMNEGGYVTKDMFQLYDNKEMFTVHEKISSQKIDHYVIRTPKADMVDFMLAPLIPFNWLNANQNNKILKPHLKQPILLVIRKNETSCLSCIVSQYPNNILYENNSYLLFNTKIKLGQLCKLASEPNPNDFEKLLHAKNLVNNQYFQNEVLENYHKLLERQQKSPKPVDVSECHYQSLIRLNGIP